MRLLPVETSYDARRHRAGPDLDDRRWRACRGDDADYRYSVAWIDCLAPGRVARSLGALARRPRAARRAARRRCARRPLRFEPRTRARRAAVGAERAAQPADRRRVQRALVPRARRRCTGSVETISSFFHPLDGVRGWNRIYGSRGFLQYQYVVPDGADGRGTTRRSRC